MQSECKRTIVTYFSDCVYSSGQKKVPVSVVCNAVSFPFRWRSVSVFLCVSLLNPCHIKLMVVKQLKINTLA